MSLTACLGQRLGCRVLLGGILLVAGVSSGPDARAAEEVEVQTREFVVHVDGKPTGQTSMRISRFDDDSEVMYGKSSVTMSFVVYTYRYASTGEETWKDGRLQKLQNVADFNGTKYRVLADRKGDGLRL